MRLLVAESDPALATFLQRGFSAESYAVDLTASGGEAQALAQQRRYDAAILDLNLPQQDGLAVLRQVRASGQQLPILILSTRTRAEDRAQALDWGADDLVVKPFAFSELSARVRALLRRGHAPETVLRIEDLELSRVERTVKRGERSIWLTPKEFGLLEFLMRNAGRPVTRAQIVERVWNLSCDTMTNVVDVYVNYSSSQVDKRRVGRLSEAIQVAFQQMGIFDAANTKPIVLDSEQPTPLSNVQIDETVERLRKLGKIETASHSPVPSPPPLPNMDSIQKRLESSLAVQIHQRTVSVTSTKDGIVVSLRELGFFDSGSPILRAEAEPALAEFVKVVGPLNVRIRIEGHTDNVPIHTPKFDSNWELSTARATEIIKVFIARFGMVPDRLSASGYGEYYPVASNDTSEGRALNRRVDLVILNSSADSSSPLPSIVPGASPKD